MNPDDFSKILDELGERLGPAGERVFAMAVQYKVTDALVGLTFSTIIGVVAALSIRLAWKHQFQDQYDGEMVRGLTTIGAGAVLFFALFMACANAVTLLNPEYAAIRDLLSRIP